MRADIGIVVLAAGGSTRLGEPKQLLVWQGETLLRRAVQLALSTHGNVVVVFGAQAERMQQELDGLDVTVAVNPDWETGMGSSVRAGINALIRAHPGTVSVIIMLCDQPLLTREILQELIEKCQATGARAVVCRYGETSLGPPCLFNHSLFSELRALNGAQGAKKVFGALPSNELAEVSFPGGKQDIDTPADWQAFFSHPPPPLSSE